MVHLGRTKEATDLVDEYLAKYSTDEGGTVTGIKALLLAKAGKEREAEETIQHAVDLGNGFGHFHHTAYNIACAYAVMKKPDEAIKWLQKTADDGFPCYPFFAIEPELDNLRNDPRFIEFMEKGKAQTEKYRELASS